MNIVSQFALPGVVFVLTLASGFWLSSLNKPLNAILFNLHKLIALGAVVLIVLQMVKSLRTADTQVVLVGLIILAEAGVVALFATGALMSIGKVNYSLMRVIHILATFLAAGGMAGVVLRLGQMF